MKYVAIVLGVFLLLCGNPTLQIPQFRNCSIDIEESMQRGCGVVRCDGEELMHVSCGVYRCLDQPVCHTRAKNSKPHPACCSGPICRKEA